MIPPVGALAQFTFTTPFASLDGVYLIVKTMTFETALRGGVDFVASLYTPAGLTAAQYATDFPSYAKQTVLQLQGVGSASATTYYVPVTVLAQLPDPTVQRYSNVYLAIKIGPFADVTKYTFLKSQLDDLVASVTGNTDTSQFYANPADDVYLTQAEYNALQATRAANIKTINPLTTQIASLQAQVDALQTLVNYYQQTLIQLSQA